MITVNARGARTIAQSRPLLVDGQRVYVTYNHGHTVANLTIGGHYVAERPASEVATILAAQDWAYEVIEARSGA